LQTIQIYLSTYRLGRYDVDWLRLYFCQRPATSASVWWSG